MEDREIIKRLRAFAGKEAFLGHYGNDDLLSVAAKRLETLSRLEEELERRTKEQA